MFTLRRFSPKVIIPSEMPTIPDQKLPLFEDSENARHFEGYISPLSPRCCIKSTLSFVGKVLVLVFALVGLLFSGRAVKYYAPLGYNAFSCNKNAPDHRAHSHKVNADRPISISAPPWAGFPVRAQRLEREGWGIQCSSVESSEHDCKFAFDATNNTFWKSADDVHGHSVEIDLRRKVNVHSLAMTPYHLLPPIGGSVLGHQVHIATEKGNWNLVAMGTWRDNIGEKFATFEPRLAQFVRLTILDTAMGAKYATIDEINIYTVPAVEPPVANGGKWGVTVNFPLVPVTSFLNPISHNVITMASYEEDHYDANAGKTWTCTATWDAKTGKVEEQKVGESKHDMFCPGTSYDESGKVIITGGSSPSALSVYDPVHESYYTPNDSSTGKPTKLEVGRGYQGQTFLPSGKTFMIGGAWSGGNDGADRDGELYDPATNSSRILRNVTASSIRMYTSVVAWQQHHAWLFAWKKNSIFHAGPSKKMHWFFIEPTAGKIVSADGLVEDGGSREGHGDAVCAITSMYDAENGTILVAGGAPNYHYWVNADDPAQGHRMESNNLTFEIYLGEVEPGNILHPTRVTPMKYQRIFANAVILPNGETFVVGGQIQGEPFHDETWQAVPEIYSPDTKTWREVARHSTPRVYHSWAMLLPDASVIVGGGGLSRNVLTDHYDAQIYQPAYLFESDGQTLAKRPNIKTIDAHKYLVGGKITITTDVPVDAASLIRYSATTHTVNNDLRRIKLTPTSVGNAAGKTYTVQIPGEPGVTLPGYWMLFVLAKGVPSHAETVQILIK